MNKKDFHNLEIGQSVWVRYEEMILTKKWTNHTASGDVYFIECGSWSCSEGFFPDVSLTPTYRVKLFDGVRTKDREIIGILVDMEASDNIGFVDTIIGHTYQVKLSNLERIPEPKGLISFKSEIPKEALATFRKLWESQIKHSEPYKSMEIKGKADKDEV